MNKIELTEEELDVTEKACAGIYILLQLPDNAPLFPSFGDFEIYYDINEETCVTINEEDIELMLLFETDDEEGFENYKITIDEELKFTNSIKQAVDKHNLVYGKFIK